MHTLKDHPLSLLFARHTSALPCRCCAPGYCPAHGAYQPPTDDQEVLDALHDANRPRRAGMRVQRKALAE